MEENGSELDELNDKVLTFRMGNIEKRLHDVQVKVNILASIEKKVDLLEKRVEKIEQAMKKGIILER